MALFAQLLTGVGGCEVIEVTTQFRQRLVSTAAWRTTQANAVVMLLLGARTMLLFCSKRVAMARAVGSGGYG